MAEDTLATIATLPSPPMEDLTIRDLFATFALNSFLNNASAFPDPVRTATACYAYANAMLLVRSHQP